MTIVTSGEFRSLNRSPNSFWKLVDVLKVTDITDGAHIER